jgi:hypothetical protein
MRAKRSERLTSASIDALREMTLRAQTLIDKIRCEGRARLERGRDLSGPSLMWITERLRSFYAPLTIYFQRVRGRARQKAGSALQRELAIRAALAKRDALIRLLREENMENVARISELELMIDRLERGLSKAADIALHGQ